MVEDFWEITRNPTFDIDESVTKLDFFVHFSSQVLYPKLSFEYFLGVGANHLTATRKDVARDFSGRNRNGISENKSTKLIL